MPVILESDGSDASAYGFSGSDIADFTYASPGGFGSGTTIEASISLTASATGFAYTPGTGLAYRNSQPYRTSENYRGN